MQILMYALGLESNKDFYELDLYQRGREDISPRYCMFAQT